MIKFECETCFQEYKVRDDRAGQVLKCKSCGSKMRVPAGDDDFEDDLYEDFEEPVRPTRKKKPTGASKKKSSGNSNNPITIIAGVCAFGIAFFVAYTFVGGLFGDKNNEAAQHELVNISQELKQLRAKMKEYSEAVKKATSKEERQPILDKMKTTLARIKELKAKQKASIAAIGETQSPDKVANKSSRPTSQEWVSLIDPPRTVPKWPEVSQISIDLDHSTNDRIHPHSVSPYMGQWYDVNRATHLDVWNLVTEKKVNELSIDIKRSSISYKGKAKLSEDGKYLLLAFQNYKELIPRLECWDVMNDKLKAEWDAGPKGSTIEEYNICSPTRAISKTNEKVDGKYHAFLKLWDLTTGKLIKEREIESLHLINSSYKISPGGKYLIAHSYSDLYVYDLGSLDLIYETKLKDFLNSDEDYYNIADLDFSADGKELGLLVSGSNSTTIWIVELSSGKSNKGFQISGSLSQALREPGYVGSDFVWNPDGAGWLLYGAWYVDRQRRQLIWTLKPVPNVTIRDEVFLTPHYLIASTATALKDENGRYIKNREPRLVAVPIPEQKISDSLSAYESKSDAILGAGQEISINVNIGELKFGNADEVKSILTDVIQKRLEADGFKIMPDQPLVFKLEYQEQEGNKLQLSKRGAPTAKNPLGRIATGKSIQSTAAVFKLSWIDQPAKKTLWSKQALVNPRFLILRDATAEEARKQMFEGLQNRLMAEAIPYFIPENKKLSMLPVEIKLPE
ncbi:WD40 repeat domain-containing protein [Gimesia aquarii]|uniref:Uncharacterized protein n=1 Tax=Gimesia aquarii TaxID=2527964 RepID=A0A517VSV1_9PLAN|nr:WD40 repeat domain-containing protein [Gimesia aquarii]QDT96029.1 hypothetical protein V144x_14820 [Gimesia aquarii]